MRILKRNSGNLILFVIGLLSKTQINVVGWIGISELYCFFMAPFFLFADFYELKRNGFMPLLWLCGLCFASGVLSNVANHIPFYVALKGLSAAYAIFAICVTIHHYSKRDLRGIKWLIIGIAISTTLSQFVFQQGNTRVTRTGEVLNGADALENAMGYSLFWLSQLGNWLCLPIRAWYLETPTIYTVAAASFIALFGFLSSNNRSSMLGIVPVALFLIGGRKIKSMKLVGRYFWILLVCGVAMMPLSSATYKYMARSGMLGEYAQNKYEKQTRRGTDMMSILVGGRPEFFVGLFAVLERPILGLGSWAIDYKGYYENFLRCYGDAENWKDYYAAIAQGPLIVPTHSQIVCFWLWNGIGGLILMLYIGWLYFDCMKNRLYVIPEWYGYFCLCVPPAIWAWLFSPFGGRVSVGLLLVMCLYARAVSMGRYRYYHLPLKALGS